MSAKIPIIDLHCDLLSCIVEGKGKYNFDSNELNCSLPQLSNGNVKLQVLAISAITGKNSSLIGEKQIKLYCELLATQNKRVGSFKEFSLDTSKVHFLLGIENASSLIEEEENLSFFFQRLDRLSLFEKILYIGITWNQENRFGGGNLTTMGLKEDGKSLLEYLDGKKIAVDLSHTSDQLAYDVLDYIEKKSLRIPLVASHSNYRAICNEKRNLPEEIAKKIIAQRGLIGLNFVRRFVGNTYSSFIDHVTYALSLGGEDTICLGSDFYGGIDIPMELCPGRSLIPFFPEYAHSGLYGDWIRLLEGQFSDSLIEKICYKNVQRFLDANGVNESL